jgi:ComF family protein
VPLLDFLFPTYSLLEREGEWITSSELSQLVSHPRLFEAAELHMLGMASLDRVLAVSTYSEAPLLRKAIHAFKYRRIPAVGEKLKEVFKTSFLTYMSACANACICPVPLHFTRKFWRGFNQAEILAGALADATGLPLTHLLMRIRPTGHQARRPRGERLTAMKGAFRVRARARAGVGTGMNWPFCVYLVDDLFTTGATMEECARVLKEAGVMRVEGVVLAHG